MDKEISVRLFETKRRTLFRTDNNGNCYRVRYAEKLATPEDGSIRIFSNDIFVQCNKHRLKRVQASKYSNGIGWYCTYRKGRCKCKCTAFVSFDDLLHVRHVLLT